MARTLWFVFVILAALPASAGVSFSGTLYNTPDNPNGVVSADLNRDGLPDMAIASDNMVSVYLATSPGNFGAEADYTVSGNDVLGNMLAADFNGDGALDLIVRHNSLAQLSILWNNGGGTFRTGPTLNLGSPVVSFDLGDFNHDGLLDVATVECTSGFPISCSMKSYKGKGKGVFTKVQSVHLSSIAYQAAVADMNGDSIPDLVISRTTQIVLWWGKGDGTFSGPTYLSPKGSDDVESFAIGDFTNDSKLDIVVNTGRNLSSFMGCVSGGSWFYKNTGGKNFSLLWSSPGGCSFLDPIDMNGDLNQDLIYQNPDPNSGFFTGLLGNGDGTFHAPTNPSFPNQGGGAIAVRDVNVDSRDDYIVGFGGIADAMVSLQTGGAKSCKPPSSATLAAKICAPAAGSTVTSPVSVQAAGNSPAGVIQLQVWIDGVKQAVKWHDEISKKFSLPSGTHLIAVVANDKYLGSAKTTIHVTVP
jgi:hypothetical protein